MGFKFNPLTSSLDLVGSSTLDTSTATSFTAGSVIFTGSDQTLQEDNANIFWDDSNNRLGVGTATPTQPIHTTGNIRTGGGILFDSTSPAHTEGLLFYDSSDQSLNFYNGESAITLNIGQENWIRVRNNTGSTITDGQVCYISGAVGQMPTIALADADSVSTAQAIGVATHSIENNTNGFITNLGTVHDLDTSAFTDGDIVYLSSTAGAFTATAPTFPAQLIRIGVIARSHVNQGVLLINIEHLTGANFTSGSVIFANSTGLAHDNANFFWDDTNNRLGIGTASPLTSLHVQSNATVAAATLINNGSNAVTLLFRNTTPTTLLTVGTDTGANAFITAFGQLSFDTGVGSPLQFSSGGVNAMHIDASQRVGFNTNSPTAQTHTICASSSRVAEIIKGAASQTANLTQWQNSSGTVLTSVAADGTISSPGAGSTSEHFGASSTAAGLRAISYGYTATASNTDALALGWNVTASGSGSVAIGSQTSVSADFSTAVGYNATANFTQALAFGSQAFAGPQGVSLGQGAQTHTVSYGIAIGAQTLVTAAFGFAFGAGASVAHGGSIVIGQGTASTAINQFIVGGGNNPIADVYIGSGVLATSPPSFTLQGSGGSGTDIAGANVTIAGGKGTGSGAGGYVAFSTSAAGASGTTLRSLSERMRITSDGLVGIGITPTAQFHLVNSTASNIAQVVKGASAQSANLTEWQNSSATVLLKVTSAGDLDVTSGNFIRYNGVKLAYGQTALSNYFFGTAGNPTLATMTGSLNNAFGAGALNALSSGSENVAIGINSAGNVTTGVSNVAIGRDALLSSTTAGYQVAIGYRTLRASLTTGTGSVAIGQEALENSISSSPVPSTAIGYFAANAQTTGYGNTAVGSSTLTSNTTGIYNMAVGYQALTSIIGSQNLGFGAIAGGNNTAGDNNIYLGYNSASNQTSGSKNIIIGASIDAPSSTGSNQLNIGNIIFATGASGTGTTIAGLVGVGTNAPVGQFDVTTLSASRIGQIIKGAASQTANLLAVQNSSGTVISGIGSTGKIFVGSGPALSGNYEASLAGIYGFVDGATRTGATTAISYYSAATFASDVTSQATGFRSSLSTAASAFTVVNLRNFQATNATLGAGSTITTQYGLDVSDLTSGSTNYGARLQLSSGANKWNIYADGTATNYLNGNVGIGNSAPDQRITIDSTTNAFMSFKVSGSTKAFYGTASTNDNPVTGMVAGDLGFRVQGGALFFSGDSGTTGHLVIKSTGLVGVNNTAPTAQLHVVNSTAGNVASVVKAAASQTANLQEWQNSSATILSKVDNSGFIHSPGFRGNAYNDASNSISILVYDGGTVNSFYDGGGVVNLRLIGGTGVVHNDSGTSTLDFRMEGDTADHLFFMDASADKIGINQSAPACRLHLTESTLGNEVFRLESVATNTDPAERFFQNRVTTTGTTATTIHTVAIPATTTVMVEAKIVARRTGGVLGTAEDGGVFEITGAFKNVAGTATQIGATQAGIAVSDSGTMSVAFTPTGSDVLIEVTGDLTVDYTWHVHVRTYAVSS
jgi:hypothetical protein